MICLQRDNSARQGARKNDPHLFGGRCGESGTPRRRVQSAAGDPLIVLDAILFGRSYFVLLADFHGTFYF